MKKDPETSLNSTNQEEKEEEKRDRTSTPGKNKKKRGKKQKEQKEPKIDLEEQIQIRPENIINRKDIPRGDISDRLAVLNIDWDSIGASEIYRVINVFASKEKIKRVSLYKTKLGKIELEKEEKEGPPILTGDTESIKHELEIRDYLKKKMKYFYAVVELETDEIAQEIYAAIDGLEIEDTHNYIDVRFIPASTEIDDELVEEITEPSKYIRKIPINSIYSTNPKLKWDEDPVRERYLKDLFDKDFDLGIANDLIDASDDEDKQAYYKKIMQIEDSTVETAQNKPKKQKLDDTHKENKEPATPVDEEDINVQETDSQEEESSEAVLLGEDSRFTKKSNNPDYTVDITHPAYIAKHKKPNKNKR